MPRSRWRGPGWWKELFAFLLPELISRLKGSDSSASTKHTLKGLLLPGRSGKGTGKKATKRKRKTATHACPVPCLAGLENVQLGWWHGKQRRWGTGGSSSPGQDLAWRTAKRGFRGSSRCDQHVSSLQGEWPTADLDPGAGLKVALEMTLELQ